MMGIVTTGKSAIKPECKQSSTKGGSKYGNNTGTIS